MTLSSTRIPPMRSLAYLMAVWAIRGLFFALALLYVGFFFTFSVLLVMFVVAVTVLVVMCQAIYHLVSVTLSWVR